MASKKRNVIVGQSGGPTSVINSSLAGVYKNAIERGFDKVYGMLHGVQGLLDEQYVDMSTQIHSDLDIESSLNLGILKTTEEGIVMTWAIRSSVKSLKTLMMDKLRYMTEFLRFWTSWRLIPLYISEETTPWIPWTSSPAMQRRSEAM